MATSKSSASKGRKYNVRADTLDFRDLMYEATLVEVPTRIPLADYRKARVPVLNQGQEGACTGFGLATVAHYLLRTRHVTADPEPISPRMFYQMAKRYDEWSGEDYDGSSARGAMKGWHKHGVCDASLWPYDPKNPDGTLNERRARDAAGRPLGAYYRVRHHDIVAMHAALAEVKVLYATATVHAGWNAVGRDGVIRWNDEVLGGHAFAIVAYDERGFWIQNSWDTDWGMGGFGLLSYDDWLKNATDVWVARLGAPIKVETGVGAKTGYAGTMRARSYSLPDLRPHIISIGNDGQLRSSGQFGTTAQDVEEIIQGDFQRITSGWKKRRLLLYAHGGLTDEDSAIQRLADYREPMLEAEVYPLCFIWKTDYWTTLKNMLADALSRRRPEGFLDSAKDFMLDRLDDALEPIARRLTGKAEWDEMKQNGQMATTGASGGARLALDSIDKLQNVEIHVVGHSAGSIFHAPLVQRLTADLGRKIESCTLWAPACTMALFEQFYLPAIQGNKIGRFALFTLTDAAEQDDNCANIYHKSLLYLVSNAFENPPRIPLFRDGVPLLGMEKFAGKHARLGALVRSGRIDWVKAPNTEDVGSPDASGASHHGDFDDDPATVKATLARILDRKTGGAAQFSFKRTAAGLRQHRGYFNR